MTLTNDLELFCQGNHGAIDRFLGAHPLEDGSGTLFRVWAPNADQVSVIGDFNHWQANENLLAPLGDFGVWAGKVSGVGSGTFYKYAIRNQWTKDVVEKADPVAFQSECPPRTASVVTSLEYDWADDNWMSTRQNRHRLDSPISIYELHLGSWLGKNDDGTWPTYEELGKRIADHVESLGYTHVELLPILEHPFDGSWGYQVTGYFSPTARFGTPQDFMGFVDHLHQRGIGIILDWVPAHFPLDPHGLARFDGTALYEHEDNRLGFHPDWKTAIFNYGRNEVRSFLLSSAAFWMDTYHLDGIRVDAVASMLYRDYSREEGEWIPNADGGRENWEAVTFLKDLNEHLYGRFPDCLMMAEESTAWPGVSKPTYDGGLGFGYKWDMGWMHDTLSYFSRDCIHRRHHQDELTFRAIYANNENFILPLSHDEVVHGKGSLLSKMPGDEWQQFANLRLLYASQFAAPGKKLHFMGSEYAPWEEWDHDRSVASAPPNGAFRNGIHRAIGRLNELYRTEPSLSEGDCAPHGFEWVDFHDANNSVLAFLRRGHSLERDILIVLNHTPVPRENYRVGVTLPGRWLELFNSDAIEYGGSGVGNCGSATTDDIPCHNRPYSLSLCLPPLGALFLRAAE